MSEEGKITSFKIECLDHVAIRVRDMDISRQWYEEVLGLTSYRKDEWGDVPVFLLAGTTGVALFPANNDLDQPDPKLKHIKIDHFAFRLANEDFEQARKRYEEIGLEYQFQDHHYFHSIYTRDPDGHIVELTTLVVSPGEFYQQ